MPFILELLFLRNLIEDAISSASPSYGHFVLASLSKAGKAKIVWTTNFDRMIEDATTQMLGGTSGLVTASLDGPGIAMEAINEGRWPLIAKIHGDFQSRRLKNTVEELQNQDSQIRYALIEACKRFGLVVIGYSGRDISVMEALKQTVDQDNGFPAGLFWLHHSGDDCLPLVTDLIDYASSKGIDAHIINIETFDELMGDILLQLPDLKAEVESYIKVQPVRISYAPIPDPDGSFPVIRLNALPILSYPTICRRFECNIGGTQEVYKAIKQSEANVIASRRSLGVIAFGSDNEVKKAFDPYHITSFDIHAIDPSRLRYESAEHGMLLDALCRALRHDRPVIVERRGHTYFMAIDIKQLSNTILNKLHTALRTLGGKVPQTNLNWTEAIRIHLQYRLDRLWLLFEPTIMVDKTENDLEHNIAKEFIRNRLVTRYNSMWNQLYDAWTDILTNGQNECEIRTFGISDGIDAVFKISKITAYSMREVVHNYRTTSST